MEGFAGAILAGGESRRLGRSKISLRLGQNSLLENVIGRLSPLFSELFVVTSREMYSEVAGLATGMRIELDMYPGAHVMGALCTALKRSRARRVFVAGCDMPFLNARLISHLAVLSDGYQAVVPEIDGLREPLHAVYSRACLPALESMLSRNRLGVAGLFDILHTRYLDRAEVDRFDPEHLSIFNVNTEEDLRIARLIAAGRDVPYHLARHMNDRSKAVSAF